MKHSIRKSLALLLTVVMVFSMLPVTAIAAGTLAPADGWTVANEQANYTIDSENAVTISTQYGDFVDDKNNTEPVSYWLMDAPEGNFELTVKVSGGLNANYQKAGVMVYLNKHIVASATRRYHSTLGNNIFGLFQYQPWTDNVWGESAVTDPQPNADAWVKLIRNGTTFTGAYSFDGDTWVDMGDEKFPSLTNENLTDDKDLKIGVFAVSGNQNNTTEVTFTDFAIDGKIIPFAAATDYVPATQINLDDDSITVTVGESLPIGVNILPEYTTDEVVWESDDEDIVTVEDGIVTGVAQGSATITVTAGSVSDSCAVTVVPSDEDGLVQYLCEEPWYEDNLISCSTGWGGLGIHTGVINPDNGNPDGGAYIKTGGTTYDHGFAAHANSRIVFDIENMGVIAFRSIIGIHSDRTKATAGFTVMADDEVLYSRSIKGGETAEVYVAVPEGAKTLVLIGDDGGDTNDSDHTTWADPRVILDSSKQDTLRKVYAEVPEFMWVGDTPEISAQGVMVNGSEAEGGTLTYSSSNTDVLEISEDGIITAKATGYAVVTVQMTLNGVTRSTDAFVTVGDQDGERNWQLTSPDGNVVVDLSLQDNNELHYSATKGGKTIVDDSILGINTSLGNFSNGLVLLDKSLEEVNETYTMISGKASEIVNHYNELALTFAKGQANFIVYIRAYPDGYAFRYTVAKADGSEGDLTVHGETSTFALPGGSTVWAQPDNRGDGVFNHENTFSEIAIENVNVPESMPMLNKAENGLWTLITEANNYSDSLYVGSYLNPEGDGVFRLAIPRQQLAEMGTYDVTTTYPFTSPWRLAISGDLGTVVESTMVTDVSDDPYTEQDWSWVEPGFTAWTWLVGGKSIQYNYEAIKQYVDFASEMGWKYFIMDEGWQPASKESGKRYDGYYEWFDELVDYAAERGVGLIAWILAHDLDTPEEREVLAEYAEKGIVGIKVDFFDSDGQETIQLYKDIYDECVANKLIINAHGANKPTGEARTYPNVINREAVRGQEYGSISTGQTTIWAFTRGVVGPMDITPKIYGSGTTTGQQAAMNILFESGMPCMASSISDYQSSAALELLRDMPSAWDEIHFIDGYPGEFTTLARRSGTMWYAASITNGTARDAVIPLDFLASNTRYIAQIYRDGAGSRDMIFETQLVTNADTLTIPMTANGGCSVKLLAADETITGIETAEEIVLSVGETAELTCSILPEDKADAPVKWTVADSAIVSISGNVLTANQVGLTTVTVSAVDNPFAESTVIVRVTGDRYTPTENWEIYNPSAAVSDRTVIYEDNGNKITLKILKGDVDHNAGAQNVWLMDAPDGDFEITVQISGALLNTNYQKVGLAAWHDETNVISVLRRYHSYLGNNIFGMATHTSAGYTEPKVTDSNPSAPAWLKMVKQGNDIKGFYSFDGETWNECGSITNTIVSASGQLKIGVYAACGNVNLPAVSMDIENFTLNGEVIPFTALNHNGNISLVKNPEDVTVDFGTSFEDLALPAEVTVYLDNGQKCSVPVIWNADDFSTAAGEYTVHGELDISNVKHLKNPDEMEAIVHVTVDNSKLLQAREDAIDALNAYRKELGDYAYNSDQILQLNTIVQTYTDTISAAESFEAIDAALAAAKAELNAIEPSLDADILAAVNAAKAAQKAAEEAQTKAEQAEADAVTAQEAAVKAKTDAENAKIAAGEARTKAEEAENAAKEAAENAGEDADAAETAKAAAETAKALAETAQAKAEQAEADAVTAQEAAETAKSEAEAAQTAAETAQSKAEAAAEAAEENNVAAAQEAEKAAKEAEKAATESGKAASEAAKAAKSASEAVASASAAAKSAEESAGYASNAAKSASDAQVAQKAAQDAKAAAEAAQKAAEEEKAAAEEAKGDAEAAQAAAEAAQAAADAAQAAAEAEKTAAEAAKKAAEDAQAAAEAAQKAAEEDQLNAEAAEEAAAAAQTAAEAAQKAAEAEKLAAEEALKAAEDAEAAAEVAQKAAEEAQAKAEAAQKAAEEEKLAAEKAQKAAEEAQKAAEEERKAAEAAKKAAEEAALDGAKYQAVLNLDSYVEQVDLRGHNKEQSQAMADLVSEAKAAIAAAEDTDEIQKILDDTKAEIKVVEEMCPSKSYTDVAEKGWYHPYVDYMIENGYMNGISDYVFDTDGSVTRAQLVTILYRVAGKPFVEGLTNPFTDVAEGKWYTDAIIWAANEGVVKGVSETEFAPMEEITRQQIVTILYRYDGALAVDDDALAGYSDAAAVSGYAVEAMNWAIANGIVYGVTETTLAPADTATRAQICAIVMRYLNN